MYYMVFCVFAILIMSGIIGLRRGFIKTLFGFLALAISLTVTYFASPYVSSFIIKNTQIDNDIEQKVYTKLQSNLQKRVAESLKNAGVTTDLSELTDEETARILEENPDKAMQIQLIDGFNIPDTIKKSLIDNNNDDMYSLLGIQTFYKYLAGYITRLAINVLAFVATFIAIRIILLIISVIMNAVAEEEPVISGVNRVAGMLLGLIMGLIFIWIFMIIAGLAFGSSYDKMIEGNVILETLNEYNMVAKILMNI